MNKKASLLLTSVCLTSILIGCQLKDETQKESAKETEVASATDSDADANGSSEEEANHLKIEGSIEKMSISKDGDVTILDDAESIETLSSVIESARREEGIVNMSNTTHYVDVFYTDKEKQRFHFWLGEAGERSAVMRADDTHSIYTVSAAITEKIIKLIQ